MTITVLLACLAPSILLSHKPSGKPFCVVQFKRGPTYNPTMYCGNVNFILIALFFMAHKTLNSFSLQHQNSLSYLSSLVIWLKGRVYDPNWICMMFRHPSLLLQNLSCNDRFVTYKSASQRKKLSAPFLNMVM